MSLYQDLSDQQLIALLEKSDTAAFRVIYNRYTSSLYRQAYAKLQNRGEAQDMVQELFLSLWARRASIGVVTTLAGYLHVALRNQILNHFAQQARASRYLSSLQEFLDQEDLEADHLVQFNELSSALAAELANLPAKMREVFTLSRQAHLSHREIAEKLGLSEKTVKNHVNSALKILRAKLLMLLVMLLFAYPDLS